MTCSEQQPSIVALLIVAVIVGCLTHGMLVDTLKEQMAVEYASGKLPTFTLTGRDENGRQTLDYGEDDE